MFSPCASPSHLVFLRSLHAFLFSSPLKLNHNEPPKWPAQAKGREAQISPANCPCHLWQHRRQLLRPRLKQTPKNGGEPAFVQIDMCSIICSSHSRSEVSTLASETVHPGRNGVGTLRILAYISLKSFALSKCHFFHVSNLRAPFTHGDSVSAPYGLRTIAHLPAAFPTDWSAVMVMRKPITNN